LMMAFTGRKTRQYYYEQVFGARKGDTFRQILNVESRKVEASYFDVPSEVTVGDTITLGLQVKNEGGMEISDVRSMNGDIGYPSWPIGSKNKPTPISIGNILPGETKTVNVGPVHVEEIYGVNLPSDEKMRVADFQFCYKGDTVLDGHLCAGPLQFQGEIENCIVGSPTVATRQSDGKIGIMDVDESRENGGLIIDIARAKANACGPTEDVITFYTDEEVLCHAIPSTISNVGGVLLEETSPGVFKIEADRWNDEFKYGSGGNFIRCVIVSNKPQWIRFTYEKHADHSLTFKDTDTYICSTHNK